MAIPCLICGAEIKLDECIERECSLCGEKEENDLVCSKGHYVCYKCHLTKKPKDEYGLPIWPGYEK